MSTAQDELQQLRQELNFYKRLVAQMPGHVYWQDLENHFLGCNINQAKAAGLADPAAIIGTTPYDYLSKRDADAVTALNEQIMASKQAQTLEEAHVYQN